jgi:hypothetical protein
MSVKLTIQNCIPSRDDGGRCKVSEITAGAKVAQVCGLHNDVTAALSDAM